MLRYDRRDVLMCVCLASQTCVGECAPVCMKGYLQMTKVVTDVKEEAYQTILQVKHAYF